MDSETRDAGLSDRFDLRAIAYRWLPTMLAGIALVVVGLVWNWPRSLFIKLLVSFALWAALYTWRRSPATPVARALAGLLAPWLLVVGLVLAAVFAVSRGGWLWTWLTGYDIAREQELVALVATAPADAADRYPALEWDGDELLIRAGEHIVGETMIVPAGTRLHIEPGASLAFAPDASLISYSPIVARGRPESPIRFEARWPLLSWGSVGIVDAGPSEFENTFFAHGRWAVVNDIEFFGSLAVINGAVNIGDSVFRDAHGRDAVNVQNGDFLVQGNTFENAAKDCLDIDAGSGQVVDNHFVNCGDEGIDLSENFDIEVAGNTVLDDRGGRIAADNDQAAIESANTLGFLP